MRLGARLQGHHGAAVVLAKREVGAPLAVVGIQFEGGNSGRVVSEDARTISCLFIGRENQPGLAVQPVQGQRCPLEPSRCLGPEIHPRSPRACRNKSELPWSRVPLPSRTD